MFPFLGADPFSGMLGSPQPPQGIDPMFGIQMPTMPEFQDFQFNARSPSAWSAPLAQAGAALLSSGGRDFGGAMGAFGQGMQFQEAQAYNRYQDDLQRQMQQFNAEYGLARDELSDKRWGYGQEKEQERYDYQRQWNEEERRRAQMEKDRETMERKAKIEALGKSVGLERGQLESLPAYELRVTQAVDEQERATAYEEWKRRVDYEKSLESKGKSTTFDKAFVDRLQEDSFEALPPDPGEYASDEEKAAYREQLDSVRTDAQSRGLIPVTSGSTVIGYQRRWSDLYEELEQEEALIRKREAGQPIVASDLTPRMKDGVAQAVMSGVDSNTIVSQLVGEGMAQNEAVKVVAEARSNPPEGVEGNEPTEQAVQSMSRREAEQREARTAEILARQQPTPGSEYGPSAWQPGPWEASRVEAQVAQPAPAAGAQVAPPVEAQVPMPAPPAPASVPDQQMMFSGDRMRQELLNQAGQMGQEGIQNWQQNMGAGMGALGNLYYQPELGNPAQTMQQHILSQPTEQQILQMLPEGASPQQIIAPLAQAIKQYIDSRREAWQMPAGQAGPTEEQILEMLSQSSSSPEDLKQKVRELAGDEFLYMLEYGRGW